MVVAIDGPAGAGKSTVARALASALGFSYMDSGAFYRCVGLMALREPQAVAAELAGRAEIVLEPGAAGPLVRLSGEDVSAAIRTPEVSEASSRAAADPVVRETLVAKQRAMLARGDWVAEGRDIGTVVAPEAAVKVFLTADPAERARRRAAELHADATAVLAEQTLRDRRDETRAHSPLRAADGATTLDTSGLEIVEVVARISALVAAAREAA